MNPMPADEILSKRHAVEIAPGSTLGTIYGERERQVNTIHHQAVSHAGSLAVTATDGHGMIEAVEARDGGCALGVQWHPEKLPPLEAVAERPLFDYLVAQARAYAARRRTHGA